MSAVSSQSEVIDATRTWGVTVEYRGAPVKPYADPAGPAPQVPGAGISSVTVCGEEQTKITVSVDAGTEEDARRDGLAVARYYAEVMRLPAEPVDVTVR